MKKLILVILLAGAFAACQNQGTNASSAPAQDPTLPAPPKVVVEETQSALPNPSDADFEASLVAFRAKDNAKAAYYILQAIAEVKAEEPSTLNPDNKKKFENNLAALQTLADRVKSGKVSNEDALLDLFGHVDMMTAHEYFMTAQLYSIKEPAKAETSFQRAKARVASAEKKLKGESLTEYKSVLAKVNASAAKEDKKINAMGDAAGEHAHQVFMWLKNHAAKIGIHPPATDYYN